LAAGLGSGATNEGFSDRATGDFLFMMKTIHLVITTFSTFSCLHFQFLKAALLTVSLGQALEEAQARLAMRLSRTNKVSRCPLF